MTRSTTKPAAIRTVGDVRDEKRTADAAMHAKCDALEAAQSLQAQRCAFAVEHDLGALMREGRQVFYTFMGGYREAADPADLI